MLERACYRAIERARLGKGGEATDYCRLMFSLQPTSAKRSLQVKAFVLASESLSHFIHSFIHTHYRLFITSLFHSKSDSVTASLPDLPHRTRRKRCLEAAPLRDLTFPCVATSDPLSTHSAVIRTSLLNPHMPA